MKNPTMNETRGRSFSRAGFLRMAAAGFTGFQIVPRHVLGRGMTPPIDK